MVIIKVTMLKNTIKVWKCELTKISLILDVSPVGMPEFETLLVGLKTDLYYHIGQLCFSTIFGTFIH